MESSFIFIHYSTQIYGIGRHWARCRRCKDEQDMVLALKMLCLEVEIYTYPHTRLHANVSSNTYIHIYLYTNTHAHIQIHIILPYTSYIQTYTHIYIFTYKQIYTYIPTYPHSHIHTWELTQWRQWVEYIFSKGKEKEIAMATILWGSY